VRVDTGVRQGDDVSVYYDPMIAKLIVWDEDRDKALQRLSKALKQYRISGMTTNLDFLYNLANSAPFKACDLDTSFIEKHHDAIFHDRQEDQAKDLPLAALYLVLAQQQTQQARSQQSLDATSPWNNASAWRLNEAHVHRFTLALHDQQFPVSVEVIKQDAGQNSGGHAEQRYAITCNGKTVEAQGSLNGSEFSATLDGYQLRASVATDPSDAHNYSLYTQDSALSFSEVQPDLGDTDGDAAGGGLAAPMNGTMVTLLVEAGSFVKKDAPLLIMEAMKMEHTIRAPADGQILEFYFQAGDLVDGGAELVNFAPSE